MRVAYLFCLLTLGLSACAASPAAPTPAMTGPSAIQIMVASDDFAAGRPRIPFILFDGPQRVADAQAVEITAFDLRSGTPQPGWQGEAENYSDYEVPYWVVYPELPRAGFWGLQARITLAGGTTVPGEFVIEVKEQNSGPPLGQRPPASRNRTLATEPDIHKLTSDYETPEPALYQATVAELLAAGRPAAILFSTPAFCASQLCGPVLGSLKEVYQRMGDRAGFLHLEIYKKFDPLVVADEVAEWGLTSEPWLFVLDQKGQIVARLGGPVSPRELAAVLTPLVVEGDQ